MDSFNVSEQMDHFKEMRHSEKLRIVKSILNILGDDAGSEIFSLRDVVNNFGDSVTDGDLIGIFEFIMESIADFKEYESNTK